MSVSRRTTREAGSRPGKQFLRREGHSSMESTAMQRGKFISFEGSEGCGKSTQIRRFVEWLRSLGYEVLVTREPGGTPAGEKIRHLLQHDPDGERLTPESELLLFAASRAQLVREVILPALDRGAWVVADRFLDSTTIYQGVGRGLDREAVACINAFAVGSALPDLTFLLDLDAAQNILRTPYSFGWPAPCSPLPSSIGSNAPSQCGGNNRRRGESLSAPFRGAVPRNVGDRAV